MSEVIFAQVCRTVSAVDESRSLILDLYANKNGTARDITAQDFINLFYSRTESGDFKFNINLDASSNELCKEYLDLSNNWLEKYSGIEFQIAERVPEEYARMMGISEDCFDTSSLMRLRSELLELENICTVCQNKQVICCSLTLDELIEVLKDGDNNKNHRRSESSLSFNFTGVPDVNSTIEFDVTGSGINFTAEFQAVANGDAGTPLTFEQGTNITEAATSLENRMKVNTSITNNFIVSRTGAEITLTTKDSVTSPAEVNGEGYIISGTTNTSGATTFSGGVNPIKRAGPKETTVEVNTSSDGSTYVNSTDAEKFLMKNDKLGFSILITNPSNKVKDVELILHFRIKN